MPFSSPSTADAATQAAPRTNLMQPTVGAMLLLSLGRREVSRLCVDLVLANGRGRELDDGITPPCRALKCLPTSNPLAKSEAGHEQAHGASAREGRSIGLSLVGFRNQDFK
jgi:hypothetical protein